MPSKKRRSRTGDGARIRVGRVSLYQHHGAWWIYYRDGQSPVRQRIGLRREEAERIASEINAQVTAAAPTQFSFEPVTVPELRHAFLAYHESVLRSSVRTIDRYRTATQHLLDFVAGQRRIPAAHEINLLLFVSFLRERQVSPNGHPHTRPRFLRGKGVQFILEVCRSMYAFAERRRHLPPYSGNPFQSLPLDRMRVEDAKPIFVFDEATEDHFLRQALPWEFPIHFTLAKTGMRPGELCHLLIEDVDLTTSWLQIRNKPELGWSIKTRNERSVPLIPELREVLRIVIGDRQGGPVFQRPRFATAASLPANANRHELGKLFQAQLTAQVAAVERPLTRAEILKLAEKFWQTAGAFCPDQIRLSFLRIARRSGFPQATCPKSWRHTFATLLQDANIDPLIRQITLGHQPSGGNGALGMTAIYTHSRPETQAREIARAMQAWGSSLTVAAEWRQGR